MGFIDEVLAQTKQVAVLGHVRPDGDCVGSCLGLKNYLELAAPEVKVQVYLGEFSESFRFLKGADTVSHDPADGTVYDLCIVLDASDKERLGGFAGYFETAGRTACIDHHVTNTGFAGVSRICPDRSATCEVLYTLMDGACVDASVAACLYMGIVHDTGVFKHSNTTPETMQIAGELLGRGIPFSEIIDKTFYEKTYRQNRILGKVLEESALLMDGLCIYGVLRQKDMEAYQADTRDLDGIIDQLRITEGVECAIFLYEKAPGEYKVSMRSNNVTDVSRVAAGFGGGGHVRAAGCTMTGSACEILSALAEQIEKQLMESGLR